jgi:AcrR family transcriptional regulator
VTETEHQNVPPRRGRRPGTSSSRQVILDAARARFAEDGYATTTIRKIAADAGVNPALIMQFFGSKEDLFAAVMSISQGALSRIDQAFEGPEHGLGERVTRAHLTLWESDPQDSEALLAMLRAAMSTPQAAGQLREFIQARLLKQLDLRLHNKHDAAVRSGLAASMLMGVVVGRRIVQVPVLAAEDLESVIRTIAPAIQLVLTGSVKA